MTPDHRTYEQRQLEAAVQTFMRVDLCYHVLQEIAGRQAEIVSLLCRLQPQEQPKPGKRK